MSTHIAATESVPFAAVMLVAHDSDTFAAIRSKKRGGGLGLLGGKREAGETSLAAAIREAEEEAGVTVKTAIPLGCWVDEDQHLTAGYLADEYHTNSKLPRTLRSSAEGEALWVHRSELLGSGAIFPKWNRMAIEAYDRLYEACEISPDGPMGGGPLFSTRMTLTRLLMILAWLFRSQGVRRCWGNEAQYRLGDYRLKCSGCRRWMRFKPTAKTPAKRRLAPNAGRCVDCKV